MSILLFFVRMMSRTSVIVLGIFLLGSVIASGDQFGDFTFTQDGQTVTITKYTGSNDVVSVPETIDGLPVTSVGDYAFRSWHGKRITIASGVTNIGAYAFFGSVLLTNLTVPDGVVRIGDFAFYACGMGSFKMGNSLNYIGIAAFENCWSLTNVIIPNSVATLGAEAFRNCSRVVSLTIGGGVTNFQDSVFANCSGLKSVTINDGVPRIGKSAFVDCGSLTNVDLPKGLVDIGVNGFAGCSKLAAIHIPESVTNIGWYAFSSCSNLGSITIPDSAKGIGWYAFWYCGGLTNAIIGSGMTNLSNYAFYECPNLASAYFLGNAPQHGSNVFYGDDRLTIYYRSGATGWESTYAEHPTVSWVDAQVGLAMDHGSSIILTWRQGVLLESTNLSTGPWVTNFAASSPFTNVPTGSGKFYRIGVGTN